MGRCMETTLVLSLLLLIVFSGACTAGLSLVRRARAAAGGAAVIAAEAETLRRELAVAAAIAQATGRQIEDLTSAKRTMEGHLEVARARHAAELDELRRERAALEQELVASRTTLSERQRQVDERDERIRAAAEQIGSRDTDLETARRELVDLGASSARLEQRAADYAAREAEIAELRAVLTAAQETIGEKVSRIAGLEQQIEGDRRLHDEKVKTIEAARIELAETFKGVAAQVLEQNTDKFESTTKLRLGELLQPLGSQLKAFETMVQDTHNRDTAERSSLQAAIGQVVSMSQKLNDGAANLTKALKGDAQVQGTWGEVVLERVLEQSGLREGFEYVRQESFTDEDAGRLRPDVVVHLPGGRHVVVDSKVSLKAYEAYCSAATDEERTEWLKRHVESVRDHVKRLSDKEYWRLRQIETPDFVLMFVPIEPAFIEALRNDSALFETAFQQRIVLTSPTTLLAVLKTIEHAWHVERYNQNAQEIVRQAGRLYDKLRGFVEDLQNVGQRLSQAQTAYDDALGKLSTGKGNVLRSAERLLDLGVKVKKALPAELTAGDGEAVDDTETTAVEASSEVATRVSSRPLPTA